MTMQMPSYLKTVITQRQIESRVAVEAIDFVYANLIDVILLPRIQDLLIDSNNLADEQSGLRIR